MFRVSTIAPRSKHLLRRSASNKVYTDLDAIVKDIGDGSSIMAGGFGLCGIPENLFAALKKRNSKNLYFISNEGGVEDFGLGILIKNKQVGRITLSYCANNKELQRQYLAGDVHMELIPQGTLIERVRAGGAGVPAFFVPTGTGTVVQVGGFPEKYTSDGAIEVMSHPKESRVFDGRKYVMETALKADFALIKAWKGDSNGNLIFHRTAKNFNPDMAKAAKVAIAEVEEIVPLGTIDPDSVHLPGVYVDRIIQAKCEHRLEVSHAASEAASEEARHRIARRVGREFKNGMHVNLGIGIPTLSCNYIPEGVNIELQSENGLIGVGPNAAPGKGDPDLTDAGKSMVTMLPGAAVLSSNESFSMIRGQHLDMTVLGALEVSQRGDLANWVIPGKIVKGMGGAMDLVSSGNRVIVATTHTTKTGQSKILKHCDLPLTGARVVDTIITELAVFRVLKDTQELVLTEVAEGVTLEEVRAKTQAQYTVAKDLKQMLQ